MREIAKEWIFKAEGDYRSAEILLYQVKFLKLIQPAFIASNALKNI